MLPELIDRIWNNPQFHGELTSLIIQHVKGTTGAQSIAHASQTFQPDEEAVARLLQCSAILAMSEDANKREAAYRIATATYLLHGSAFEGLRPLLYLVLSRLGNFPAIQFSYNDLEPPSTLPTTLVIDAINKLLGNTVTINERHQTITFTDFQRQVWDSLSSGVSLSAAAPTSAGKSFLLQAFLRQRWAQRPRSRIAYLVPTRALINQVSSEIIDALRLDGETEVEIVTVPISEDQPVPIEAIFVLTQERLQFILTAHADVAFDLVIVDEAQAIGDSPRGVILTATLEELQRRNHNIQMFFASPNVANPEIFGRLFGLTNYRSHKSQDITVAQNLVHLDTSASVPRRVRIFLNIDNEKRPLGELFAPDDLAGVMQSTVHLSHLFGKGGQSLVYAKGPSNCQQIANGLAQLEARSFPTAVPSLRRQELSNFAKESVHRDYQLADNVLNGIGFHYGAMPPPLRRAIEDLFRDGELKFLVCTSTLLHGLNMPARNLFLNRPYRGLTNPIDSVDFWNLAGRAGRLGKEFEGDVYLIDYIDWPSKPLSGTKEINIKPTLDEHVKDRTPELIDYINDASRKPDSKGRDEFENTFTKLFGDLRNGQLDETLTRLDLPLTSSKHRDIVEALSNADQNVTLEQEVLRQSPTISVYRQQRLYDYMLRRIEEKGPEYLMPSHPMASGAHNALAQLFKRCHNHIFQWPAKDMRHRRAAVFAMPWMRGDPLPVIIQDHFEYEVKRTPTYTISKAILTTLDEIENNIRFTYVRLTGCYNAVLKRALVATGHAHLAQHIVALPLFMEVGACSTSMMSFIGLGLSRVSAKKLTDVAQQQNLSTSEAKRWVRGQDLARQGVSPFIIGEVDRILGRAAS